MTITRKTALITGSSRGLGATLADFLAAQGYALVLTARGREELEETARKLERYGHPVTALAGDVTDPAHRRALVNAAEDGLDLLVNNASDLGPSPLPALAEYPLEALESLYKTNVLASLGLIQEALPLLERRRGLVVNVSSDAAQGAYPGWGGYGSSKAALDLITRTLAAELTDVGVVSVDPGDMRTRMHQDAFPDEDISDRPLPDVTLPFWAWLLGQDPLSVSGERFQAQADAWTTPTPPSPKNALGSPLREMRVSLTVEDFDRAVQLYRETLGLPVVQAWEGPDGRGVVLATPQATLELLDRTHAETVDRVEVGTRVSGPIRLALEVAGLEAAMGAFVEAEARSLRAPVITPWGDRNQRLETSEGVQLTLYERVAVEKPV